MDRTNGVDANIAASILLMKTKIMLLLYVVQLVLYSILLVDVIHLVASYCVFLPAVGRVLYQ